MRNTFHIALVNNKINLETCSHHVNVFVVQKFTPNSTGVLPAFKSV